MSACPRSDPQRLIETYRSYAHAIAAEVLRKLPRSVDKDEARSAAELGLVEAANAFDPSRGVLFKTFAYYRIRGAIYDSLRKMGWLSKQYPKLRFETGMNEYLADYSAGDTSDAAPQNELDEIRQLTSSVVSCYLLSLESIGYEVAEDPARSPEESYRSREEQSRLRAAVAQLPPKNRLVLEEYYFREVTLEEIGKKLGLSKSWVSRIHAKSLDMLRELLEQSAPAGAAPERQAAV